MYVGLWHNLYILDGVSALGSPNLPLETQRHDVLCADLDTQVEILPKERGYGRPPSVTTGYMPVFVESKTALFPVVDCENKRTTASGG